MFRTADGCPPFIPNAKINILHKSASPEGTLSSPFPPPPPLPQCLKSFHKWKCRSAPPPHQALHFPLSSARQTTDLWWPAAYRKSATENIKPSSPVRTKGAVKTGQEEWKTGVSLSVSSSGALLHWADILLHTLLISAARSAGFPLTRLHPFHPLFFPPFLNTPAAADSQNR